MKHTFVFIDKILILLKDVPKSLDTEEDKAEARNIVDGIVKYTGTLKKLIENHKEEEYLNRLHTSHIAAVEGWAEQVAELFKRFDSLLNVLEGDAKVLSNVIENEPEKWVHKVSDMAFGIILTRLNEEEKEMTKFRELAIFQEHELKKIIEYEEHIADLLE